MTWLIIVGSVLGYLFVGFVASIAVAAWDSSSEDDGKTVVPVLVSMVAWPLFVFAVIVYLAASAPVRLASKIWRRGVLKLNPGFKGLR